MVGGGPGAGVAVAVACGGIAGAGGVVVAGSLGSVQREENRFAGFGEEYSIVAAACVAVAVVAVGAGKTPVVEVVAAGIPVVVVEVIAAGIPVVVDVEREEKNTGVARTRGTCVAAVGGIAGTVVVAAAVAADFAVRKGDTVDVVAVAVVAVGTAVVAVVVVVVEVVVVVVVGAGGR